MPRKKVVAVCLRVFQCNITLTENQHSIHPRAELEGGAPGRGEGEEAEAEGLERPPGHHHVSGVHHPVLEQEVVGGEQDRAEEREAEPQHDLDLVSLEARPHRGLDEDGAVTGAHCAEHTFLK